MPSKKLSFNLQGIVWIKIALLIGRILLPTIRFHWYKNNWWESPPSVATYIFFSPARWGSQCWKRLGIYKKKLLLNSDIWCFTFRHCIFSFTMQQKPKSDSIRRFLLQANFCWRKIVENFHLSLVLFIMSFGFVEIKKQNRRCHSFNCAKKCLRYFVYTIVRFIKS